MKRKSLTMGRAVRLFFVVWHVMGVSVACPLTLLQIVNNLQ